jgi:hypothetical protein
LNLKDEGAFKIKIEENMLTQRPEKYIFKFALTSKPYSLVMSSPIQATFG